MNTLPNKDTTLKKKNLNPKKSSNSPFKENQYSEINKKLEDIINNQSFDQSDKKPHLNLNINPIKNMNSDEGNLNLIENFLINKPKNVFEIQSNSSNLINNENNFYSNEYSSKNEENSKLVGAYNRLNLQLFNDDLLAQNFCFRFSNNIKQKLNKKYFVDILYSKHFEDQNITKFLDEKFEVDGIKDDLNKNQVNFGEKPQIFNDSKINDYNVTQNFFLFEANFPLNFLEDKNIDEQKEENKIDEESNYSDKINQKKMKKKFSKKGGLLQKKLKRKNNTKNDY